MTTQNANVLVDTAGYGDIFTNVCNDHPDVYCIQTAPFTKLGKNTTGWFPKLWMIEYTAGVAAGLSTKDDTVGYVLGYKLPLITGAANAFTMGCRSVNPQCEVKTVVTNDYYNPPKTVPGGLDPARRGRRRDPLLHRRPGLLRGRQGQGRAGDRRVLDQRRAVRRQRPGLDGLGLRATTTRASSRRSRTATSSPKQLEFLDPTTSFKLEDWGPNVPDDVQSQVQQTLDDLASGAENPFVGPIKDNKGKVRVKSGEKLSDEFLYGEVVVVRRRDLRPAEQPRTGEPRLGDEHER